ncbi:hypothetical protein PROFUN_11675 [Planoprotostelium fungivorum]|uniref:SAP domain-containing protein n=1 Tax=Planoprotostelium fungivorum TaxID=1890364 RepID=A0A2P6N583_9EUKA|nr:hypothetical protein PROFUN_11675 [Planoprotostelium fungivorum]
MFWLQIDIEHSNGTKQRIEGHPEDLAACPRAKPSVDEEGHPKEDAVQNIPNECGWWFVLRRDEELSRPLEVVGLTEKSSHSSRRFPSEGTVTLRLTHNEKAQLQTLSPSNDTTDTSTQTKADSPFKAAKVARGKGRKLKGEKFTENSTPCFEIDDRILFRIHNHQLVCVRLFVPLRMLPSQWVTDERTEMAEEERHRRMMMTMKKVIHPRGMSVEELKRELSERDLSTKGKKEELVNRLEAALNPHLFDDPSEPPKKSTKTTTKRTNVKRKRAEEPQSECEEMEGEKEEEEEEREEREEKKSEKKRKSVVQTFEEWRKKNDQIESGKFVEESEESSEEDSEEKVGEDSEKSPPRVVTSTPATQSVPANPRAAIYDCLRAEDSIKRKNDIRMAASVLTSPFIHRSTPSANTSPISNSLSHLDATQLLKLIDQIVEERPGLRSDILCKAAAINRAPSSEVKVQEPNGRQRVEETYSTPLKPVNLNALNAARSIQRTEERATPMRSKMVDQSVVTPMKSFEKKKMFVIPTLKSQTQAAMAVGKMLKESFVEAFAGVGAGALDVPQSTIPTRRANPATTIFIRIWNGC